MKRFFTVSRLFLAFFLSSILAPEATHAQSFVLVAPGSKFVCGYMPNGTNLIFTQKGKNTVRVSLSDAKKRVEKDIDVIEGRVKQLKSIQASLKDGILSKKEVRSFTSILKSADPDAKPLPPSVSERKEAISALISKLNASIRNKKKEISALKDCSKGKRRKQDTTVTYDFIKFKALDGLYIALVLYVPQALDIDGKPAPLRWYCIRSGPDLKGSPRLFSQNPCSDGVPAFAGNSCRQFNRKDMHTEIYAYHVFKGIQLELDDPRVIEAENEFQSKYSGGAIGIPRTSLQDDCSGL